MCAWNTLPMILFLAIIRVRYVVVKKASVLGDLHTRRYVFGPWWSSRPAIGLLGYSAIIFGKELEYPREKRSEKSEARIYTILLSLCEKRQTPNLNRIKTHSSRYALSRYSIIHREPRKFITVFSAAVFSNTSNAGFFLIAIYAP